MGTCWNKFAEANKDAILSVETWRAILAELIGTSILVVTGCGACIGQDWESNTPSTVQISFTFGLAVATVVTCIGHVSGGHINPAVTCAMVATRRMVLAKGLLYVVAQLAGAMIGSALLKAITPPAFEGDLGQTTISYDLRPFPDAVVVEGLITFILVFVVFASTDSNRNDLMGSAPLGIGLCVVFCHLFAVYWAGPLLGGLTAGLGYEFFFSASASLERAKKFLTDPNFGNSKTRESSTSDLH